MFRRTGKIISFILAVVIIFSMAVPALAAEIKEPEEYPTIYVTGAQTNDIYSAQGERIYPFATPLMDVIKDIIGPCIKDLLKGLVTGNYDGFNDKIYGILMDVFEDIQLDVNGEASDGSHPEFHSSTVAVSNKQSGYGMWDFRFWYDWRLSPIDTAEELKTYIDRVKEATGKEKVQLVGRCYGANLIQTYITLHKEHALESVSDVAYYSQSVIGIDFMSAAFSGEIVIEDDAAENFVRYFIEGKNIIKDPTAIAIAVTVVELMNEFHSWSLVTNLLEKIISDVKDDLLPKAILATIGSWPAYWSMVNPELYEASRDFVFADCKDEYAKFIEKTDKFHYEVQLKTEETIREFQANGVNFYIFTKYGFPDYPLYEGATGQGDGYTSVEKQSFGAVSANYGEVLSEEYINALSDKRYLSPDYKVDASTCLIPERSWFVKNLHHNYFEVLHPMTLEIMRYDLTVESEKYPQYIYHENNQLSIMTGPDEDYNKKPENVFAKLANLFKLIGEYLKKVVNGEINIG